MKGGTIEEILVKICGGEEGGREGGRGDANETSYTVYLVGNNSPADHRCRQGQGRW